MESEDVIMLSKEERQLVGAILVCFFAQVDPENQNFFQKKHEIKKQRAMALAVADKLGRFDVADFMHD